MKRIGFLCILLVCLLTTKSFAQVEVGDNGTLSGLAFGDYYWMAQNHNDNIEGDNGFWLRRIYLTYDQKISDSFSARLRFEMSSPGDFSSNSKMIPNVKDAYLKWHNETQQIFAGISSTPTFGLTEEVWGYRSVEKSPQDLFGYGSSRDFGIAAKGQLDGAGKLNYHFFFGNGNGNKAEINKGKKFMLALSYDLTKHVVAQVYGDYNVQPNDQDVYTVQGFAAYQSEKLNIGALFSHQEQKNVFGMQNYDKNLASIFTNFELSEKIKGYLRADHLFDYYLTGASNDYIPFAYNAEPTFLVGGIDLRMDENVHLMPNIESIIYGEDTIGQTPTTDLIPRLTLFYKF